MIAHSSGCCVAGPRLRDLPVSKPVLYAYLAFYGAGALVVLGTLIARYL